MAIKWAIQRQVHHFILVFKLGRLAYLNEFEFPEWYEKWKQIDFVIILLLLGMVG